MNLFIICVLVTILTFAVSMVYFGLIFRERLKKEMPPESNRSSNPFAHFNSRLAILFSLYVTSLVYATFGITINLFYTAPAVMPYIIAILFWLLITGVLMISALQTRQSYFAAFINIGFWLLVMATYALVFPIAAQSWL